jgi:uncharacterized RDD family membrane protein YckC
VGIAPGWYNDPADPTIQRWWDGEGWVGAPVPAGTTPPDQPPAATVAPPRPEEVPPPVPTPPPAGGAGVPPGWTYRPRPRREPPPKPHGYPLATFGARVVARIVDIAVVSLLSLAANGWLAYLYLRELWPAANELARQWSSGDTTAEVPEPSGTAELLPFLMLLITVALWFAYEVPAVANTGQTFGKRLLRIKVVRLESSQPLGFGRSFRRWNPMGFGFLAWYCFCLGLAFHVVDIVYALYDRPLQQALHDKVSSTVVVALAPESAGFVAPRGTRAGEPPVPSEEEKSDEPADPRRP